LDFLKLHSEIVGSISGAKFAVSMARVKQAYLDEFNVDVIDLNILGQDYFFSETVINS